MHDLMLQHAIIPNENEAVAQQIRGIRYELVYRREIEISPLV